MEGQEFQRRRGYKPKIGTGILTLITGGFGIHRFYLGQWWGIFYLLLFWTGIPALIALVEGIVFLATNPASWDQKHNEGVPLAEGENPGTKVIITLICIFFGIPVLLVVAAVAIPMLQG